VLPVGLGLRGRTSPLAWTPRARRAAVASALFVGLVLAASWTAESALSAVVPYLVPLAVDGAAVVMARIERRLGERWVRSAAAALRAADPTVVAITGSYGKTTTKGYVAHLASVERATVASPASFNNRMGLARAVNEHLTPSAEVFVAEMGTYSPGEIADLCVAFPPDVAVITAIGPVHLERMRSEERILAAKAEILERAETAVLSVDHPLLERLAVEERSRRRVISCSGQGAADVTADPESGVVRVDGREIGRFDPERALASNVACAVGAVIALGLDPARIGDRLATLPDTPHRRTRAVSSRGVEVVDDTYNSNPAGARAALDALAASGAPGRRRVLVTPGMVELGPVQAKENRALAQDAAQVVSDLVVVGRTNRTSLVAGAAEGGIESVIVVPSREDAVAWVREHLSEGDAVLYENDLPDHYP
jgi:UDP-N-acetylmuramoyl-tripeptide--D-alanyl-D-alanine ligase